MIGIRVVSILKTLTLYNHKIYILNVILAVRRWGHVYIIITTTKRTVKTNTWDVNRARACGVVKNIKMNNENKNRIVSTMFLYTDLLYTVPTDIISHGWSCGGRRRWRYACRYGDIAISGNFVVLYKENSGNENFSNK